MRKHYHIAIVLVAIMAMALSSCATTGTTTAPSFTETQYKALTASQELYNLSWGAFVQLYRTKQVNKAGKLIVDEERYQTGLKFATTYYNAWMTWISAVMDYEKNKGAGGTMPVEKAMAIAQKAASDLLLLIQPYLQEGGK
jgi:hypothetical protein